MARILLLDSQPASRLARRMLLQMDGHDVVDASSVSEGRAAVANGLTVDGVVVVKDPGQGDDVGWMFDLRKLRPAWARVLVGDGMDLQTMVEAVNLGAPHQVLTEGGTRDPLVRSVRQALDLARDAARDARQSSSGDGRERLTRLMAGPDFRIALQPIYTSGGGLLGHEVLIRSRDPVLRGPLAVLEEAAQQRMLDAVLHAVVRRAEPVVHELPAEQLLFLNLHAEDLRDPTLLVRTLAPLEDVAHRVVLEITGHAYNRWTDSLRTRLQPVLSQGYRIAVDDIGAGEGALVLLSEASPAFIKAHDSIVRDLNRSGHKRRLVEMLCHFATGAGAQLVAEGVEREDEAQALREAGVGFLQGFLFGVPVEV